ncbi:MAG TPA: hypothetical protein VKD66_12160 [Streptosporangiaceae bacterium]|nr:hypothetical protein [Streptosporangiaceae bacterium]
MSDVYPGVTPCHDALVLPFAAYLRVYEPLSAFSGPDARRWAGYAASAGRPRWAGTLAAEHADALRRLMSVSPVVAPERESGDAYVRRLDGATYICPWQTRLRSWLGLSRLKTTVPELWSATASAAAMDAAIGAFACCRGAATSLRVHIQARTWAVPTAWFVPFSADERWLVLGATSDRGDGGRATVTPTRTLVYATATARARGRLRLALDAFRRAGAPAAAADADDAARRVVTELEQIGRWLEEFHPDALVELDYGGLVNLLDDGALRADQSVAEVSAAIRALTSGELEMATAMFGRVARRWQALAALERAS